MKDFGTVAFAAIIVVCGAMLALVGMVIMDKQNTPAEPPKSLSAQTVAIGVDDLPHRWQLTVVTLPTGERVLLGNRFNSHEGVMLLLPPAPAEKTPLPNQEGPSTP